jgi:crotonobetainyl-CoA:carnitine CoA-transferase CaiB-like acyl-CoA transferase
LLVYVWIALGVAVVVTVATLVFALGRGLAAWRTFRHSRDRLSGGIDEMNRRVEAMEQRMTTANEAAARLERAQAELQESLAAARLLADAAAEVRGTVRRALGLLPSG